MQTGILSAFSGNQGTSNDIVVFKNEEDDTILDDPVCSNRFEEFNDNPLTRASFPKGP
jgi:hypothetical protein